MRSRVKRGNKIVLTHSYGGMQKGDTRKQKGDAKGKGKGKEKKETGGIGNHKRKLCFLGKA